MCGRFVRKGEPRRVAQDLGIVAGEENWTTSYNIAPGSTVPIVRADPSGRHMLPAVWGFTSSGRAPLFNARAETVDSLPSFRDAFRQNRCLVPASGFYEWRPSDRQPFYFERVDGLPLAFTGIWEPLDSNRISCCIITTTPSSDVEAIHDRMPVILSEESWGRWLDSKPLSDEERLKLLVPSPSDTLARWSVRRMVGNVRNDSPALIEPFEEPPREITPDLFR